MAGKKCDVPHCENVCVPTRFFDDTNITCMACRNFHCTECTKRIWTDQWTEETYSKPKYYLQGLRHEVFACAFCRAAFDRFVIVASE